MVWLVWGTIAYSEGLFNEIILLQVGGNLIRFALHLLPTTNNGLRPKP